MTNIGKQNINKESKMSLLKTLPGTSTTFLTTALIKNNIFFPSLCLFYLITVVYSKQINRKWEMKNKFEELIVYLALANKLIIENARCSCLKCCLVLGGLTALNASNEYVWTELVAAIKKFWIKSCFYFLKIVLYIIFFG